MKYLAMQGIFAFGTKALFHHILLQVFLARLAGEAGTIRTRLEERLLRDVHSIAGNFVARSLGNT